MCHSLCVTGYVSQFMCHRLCVTVYVSQSPSYNSCYVMLQALERQNTKLEEENKQLLFQLQALLQQNQELLSQTLETSEHFREEESIYRDKLAHVTRAKEKLEERSNKKLECWNRIALYISISINIPLNLCF